MWLFPLRIKTSPQKATSLCEITKALIRARIFARAEGVNPALPGLGGSLESCTTLSIMSSNSGTSSMGILCGKTIAIHQRPNSYIDLYIDGNIFRLIRACRHVPYRFLRLRFFFYVIYIFSVFLGHKQNKNYTDSFKNIKLF